MYYTAVNHNFNFTTFILTILNYSSDVHDAQHTFHNLLFTVDCCLGHLVTSKKHKL